MFRLGPPPLIEHDSPHGIKFLKCGQIDIDNNVEESLEVGDTWLTHCKVMSRGDRRDVGDMWPERLEEGERLRVGYFGNMGTTNA